MTEQIVSEEPKTGADVTGLGEALKIIGDLARRAGQGDRTAGLILAIIRKEQLAEIRNLELEVELLQISAINQAALKSMPLPEKPGN